ncbi:MAG: protein kinase [Planctomycetaceae bacterium]|nr:protein kinase [Planctomycetaceae bacterium]
MSEQMLPSGESANSPQRRVNPESIEGLFLEALEITSAAERVAFLDRVSEGDPVRRRRLEALLRAYDDSGSFLEHSPVAAAEENFDFLTPSDKPGTLGLLGHYEVIDVIGRGGMGVVFRALDPRLNRVVAIKVLAPELAASPLARRRFLREAQAAAAVSHPHVVTIHAVDEQKLPYLVMECIVGQSLQQKIDNVGPLRLTEILRIGHQIAEGLAAAHRQGLIHRDIKPGNVLLENGVERVKITDFGLARAADDAAITRTGEVSGTPQYMSPEQAKGERVDARSDLFSLGCVMYAMCTGRSPFRADSMAAAIRRVCDDAPRPIGEINPEVPGWLIEIIGILLEKKPENRFQTAEEVGTALAACLERMQRQGAIRTTQIPLPPRPATASEETIPQPLAEKDFTDRSTTAYDDFFDRGKTPVAGLATFLGGLMTALIVGFCGAMSQAMQLTTNGFSSTVEVVAFIMFIFFVTSAVGVGLRTDFTKRGDGGLPISPSLILATIATWIVAVWMGFLAAIQLCEAHGLSAIDAAGFPLNAALLLSTILIVVLTLGTSWFWVRAGMAANPDPLAVDARRAGRFLVGFAFFSWASLVTWWTAVAIGVAQPVPLGSLTELMPVIGVEIVAIGAIQLTVGLVLQRRLFGLKTYLQLGSSALLAGFAGVMVLAGLAVLMFLMPFIASVAVNSHQSETFFSGRIGSIGALEAIVLLLVTLVMASAVAAIWRVLSPPRGSVPPPIRRNTGWLRLTVIVAIVLFLIPTIFVVTAAVSHDNRLAAARRQALEQQARMTRQQEIALQNHVVPQVVHVVPDEESNWGAVLIDFGDGVSAGLPGSMGGMSPYSGRQVAIRLRPAGVPVSTDDSSEGSGFAGGMGGGDMMGAGMWPSDDVVFRRDGESFRRSHAIRESGLYRLAPGKYDVWLYDWEFGWVNPADTNEMAPQTPVAPQRGGSKRFWGNAEIKTGEIGTIQVRESDPAALYKAVAETRPKLEASDRLRTFLWNTNSYTLTERQAAIVQRLLVAATKGQPFVEESELLQPLEKPGVGQLEENPPTEVPQPVPPVETPASLPAVFNDGRHPAMAILQLANPDEHEGRRLWRLAEPRGLPKRVTFGTTMPPGSMPAFSDPLAPGMPGMPPGTTKQKPGTNIEHLVIPLEGGKKAGAAPMPAVPGGARFPTVPVDADPPGEGDSKNPAAASDAPVDALKAENSPSP